MDALPPDQRGRRLLSNRRCPVKFSLIAALLAFQLTAHSTWAQASHPRPPGVRQAEQAEAQAERDIPPPIQPRASADLSRLAKEADELARLAQTIPSDIANVNKGTLPKDVILKLKHI